MEIYLSTAIRATCDCLQEHFSGSWLLGHRRHDHIGKHYTLLHHLPFPSSEVEVPLGVSLPVGYGPIGLLLTASAPERGDLAAACEAAVRAVPATFRAALEGTQTFRSATPTNSYNEVPTFLVVMAFFNKSVPEKKATLVYHEFEGENLIVDVNADLVEDLEEEPLEVGPLTTRLQFTVPYVHNGTPASQRAAQQEALWDVASALLKREAVALVGRCMPGPNSTCAEVLIPLHKSLQGFHLLELCNIAPTPASTLRLRAKFAEGTAEWKLGTTYVELVVAACIVPGMRNLPFNSLVRAMLGHLCSQLRFLVQKCAEPPTVADAQVHLFLPKGLLRLPLTVPGVVLRDALNGAVDVTASLNANEATRLALHLALGLPTDTPVLRPAQATQFVASAGKTIASGTLRPTNVHEHVPACTLVSGGATQVVKGTYEYFHYMHDGLNDKGWGCAYRSLQTICSWFIRQSYAQGTVPSVVQIQRVLELIDFTKQEGTGRPGSFVGSSEWIGSSEITYVLEHLYGVECRQEHVGKAEHLPQRGRLLLRHFETYGTPVMIGGDMYAYTILGVKYDCDTGELALLVLDPHYTGEDDVKTIVAQGFCGWKKVEGFLKPGSFYNLCMPRLPSGV